MNSNNNLLNYILIAVVIIFIIHILFKKTNGESFNPNIEEDVKCEKKETKNFYDHYHGAHLHSTDVKNDCPIPTNRHEVNDYIFNHNIAEQEKCPLPVKSIKKFHDDFFRFRDITQQNTTSNIDPVDRITQLYLEDNTEFARRYPNLKISDIFDKITAGPTNLYKRHCARLPSFDNINYDGYKMSHGAHPMHLTRDNWTYENEKVMNGGEIKPGLRGISYD